MTPKPESPLAQERYTIVPFSSVVGSGVWDSKTNQILVLVPNRGNRKETEALAKICAEVINLKWSGKTRRKP